MRPLHRGTRTALSSGGRSHLCALHDEVEFLLLLEVLIGLPDATQRSKSGASALWNRCRGANDAVFAHNPPGFALTAVPRGLRPCPQLVRPPTLAWSWSGEQSCRSTTPGRGRPAALASSRTARPPDVHSRGPGVACRSVHHSPPHHPSSSSSGFFWQWERARVCGRRTIRLISGSLTSFSFLSPSTSFLSSFFASPAPLPIFQAARKV